MTDTSLHSIAKRYTMSEAASQLVCKRLVEGRSKLQRLKPYGVYILDGNDERSDIGRKLERDVFYEFFKNDEYTFAEEYGPYEAASELIVIVDHRKLIPVGMARLVKYNQKGLKTFNDTTHPDSPWGLTMKHIENTHTIAHEHVWDIATIAVKRRYKSKSSRRLIRSLLMHALYIHAVKNGALHWVALLDDMHINTFAGIGIPVENLGGAKSLPYLGSASTRPIIVKVADVESGVMNNSRLMHAFIIKGVPLRQIASF
jgi:hypothetical protein